MKQMMEMLNTILPVILVLFIGILVRWKKMLSREGIDALKSLVVNITLPAVMLNAFASMSYSFHNIIITVMMFAVCLLAWFLGRFFSSESRFMPFLTTGFEAGMLGYALFMLLYGQEKISAFAAVDLGQVLFVFTLYKILLGTIGTQKPSGKELVSGMVHSPTMIAIVAGVLIGATGLYAAMKPSGISGLMDACTDFVSAPTSAVILLTIGYDLNLMNIPWKAVMKAVGIRIAIMALMRILAGFVVNMIGMGDSLIPALNIMFILPPPYVLPVFADDEKQRGYVSSVLSISTLVSILCFVILSFSHFAG